MIRQYLLNKVQTVYVTSAMDGETVESTISTNIEKVVYTIKLDVFDFYLNHPKCSHRQALKEFLSLDTKEEVHILSRDRDSYLQITICGDCIEVDFCDTAGDKPIKYSLQTHYISRD